MMNKLKAIIALLCCIVGVSSAQLFAEEQTGIKTSTDLNFVIATTLEAKASISETVTVPFLVGANALTSGNNVQFSFGAEVSPVSVNGTVDAVWTPIAFLQFYTGGSVGTGWNIPIASGLRTNERELPPVDKPFENGTKKDASFGGAVWSGKAGGVFQFDFAAIKPGDWNHVVLRTAHHIKYRAYSDAASDESWLYEADAGENRNGLSYYGNYLLGYQMPIVLNTVGMLVETDKYLFDTKNSELWGDELIRWTFGPLFNFKVSEKTQIALLVQWNTPRNFTAATEKFEFYQDRRLADEEQSIKFYRAALNIAIKLK